MDEDLAAETARRLIAAYHADGREPSLRFPPLRDGRRRVSEQEARVVMCQVLEGDRSYSIEYPTNMRHSFSGQALLSARIDLAVWSAHGMDLAVEFKAGQPRQEAIDKDMVKLVGEGVRGLWLHTLEVSNSATLPSLFGKLKVGLENGCRTWLAVQQAMALFFQADIRSRCVPNANCSATDVADLIRNGGTIYLLGREDPYASASPLMTAVAESVLDTALTLANSSPFGRLCPPMLACLDELPSTAPLPTLRTRMANERALGLSFIYAAQTWRQLASIFGEQDARALLGLTNVLCIFGGSKDVRFNQEVSDLLGPVRIARHTWQMGTMAGRSSSAEDIPILTGAEVRQLPDRHALVVAENGKPIIARLHRAVDGQDGRALEAARQELREQVERSRCLTVPVSARTAAAHAEARRRGLGGDGR